MQVAKQTLLELILDSLRYSFEAFALKARELINNRSKFSINSMQLEHDENCMYFRKVGMMKIIVSNFSD
jgi:hypothetical protein